jgi:hypothetical protein
MRLEPQCPLDLALLLAGVDMEDFSIACFAEARPCCE